MTLTTYGLQVSSVSLMQDSPKQSMTLTNGSRRQILLNDPGDLLPRSPCSVAPDTLKANFGNAWHNF